MKHNNVVPNAHFKKDWQRFVRVWLNQPAKKAARRAARTSRAVRIAPRPLDKLRPVVRGQSVKYNTKVRAGRGFTLDELKVCITIHSFTRSLAAISRLNHSAANRISFVCCCLCSLYRCVCRSDIGMVVVVCGMRFDAIHIRLRLYPTAATTFPSFDSLRSYTASFDSLSIFDYHLTGRGYPQTAGSGYRHHRRSPPKKSFGGGFPAGNNPVPTEPPPSAHPLPSAYSAGTDPARRRELVAR